MPTITVRDMQRLALPPATHLVAGSAGLGHQVTWVTMLRPTLPAFAELRGGEVALLSVEAALALDPRLTLATLVRRLASAPVPVAAIVFLGPLRPEDVDAAEATRLPLLQLPADCDLQEIEREIARLISDYEAQRERRAAQLYNLLTQRSLAGDGVPGLLQTLSEYTGQSVACYSAAGEFRNHVSRGSARLALQALRPTTAGKTSMLGHEIWVATIGTGPAGFLAIAGTELSDWDQLAAAQGAVALAIEFAKEQAVQAAEDRLRGDFVSNILANPNGDFEALLRRGQEMGYDLNRTHVALMINLDAPGEALVNRLISRVQTELSRRNVATPISRRESGLLCLLPMADDLPRPRDIAEQLRERITNEFPGLAMALGTPAQSLAEWRRTRDEAEQALILGRQLFGHEQVFAFADLGIYRILVRLRETPELWTFYRETLSALAAYDQRQGGDKQGGELLKTLDAYFSHLGNLRATSEALHVHRNTLLYRLERIKQISGKDLDNAEEYFALWLALRAHRVLRSMEET
jgi:purine catabolism regulator